MREVEIKAACTPEALAALKDWLLQRGYVRTAEYRQTDDYYDHPARSFAETDEALRLRRVISAGGETAELCYKGPNRAERGQSREELESAVSDAAAVETMLRRLGFWLVATVKKERCSFAKEDVTVSLDRVEELGCFFEMEILCPESETAAAVFRLEKLMEELHFASPREEKRTYLELLLEK